MSKTISNTMKPVYVFKVSNSILLMENIALKVMGN